MDDIQSLTHFAAITTAALGEVALSTTPTAHHLTSLLEEVVHVIG